MLTCLSVHFKENPASEPGIENAIRVTGAPLDALPAQNSWGAWGTIQLLGELYLLAFGDIMLTSKEYLQQAAECLQLANVSSDVYVKEALTELASDFKAMAKEVRRPPAKHI